MKRDDEIYFYRCEKFDFSFLLNPCCTFYRRFSFLSFFLIKSLSMKVMHCCLLLFSFCGNLKVVCDRSSINGITSPRIFF